MLPKLATPAELIKTWNKEDNATKLALWGMIDDGEDLKNDVINCETAQEA